VPADSAKARKWTHRDPLFKHSSQPRALGVTLRNSGHMGAIPFMVCVPTALGDWKRRIGKIAVQGGNNLSTLTNRPTDALD
jgi:hypothetical protein